MKKWMRIAIGVIAILACTQIGIFDGSKITGTRKEKRVRQQYKVQVRKHRRKIPQKKTQ